MILDTLEFKTDDTVTLQILGAVHGNEKCGTVAVNRVAKAIESGELKLIKGTLRMVAITNPLAYEQDIRFTDRNLNRQLHPSHTGSGYEDGINPELCALLEQADVLLDLHSYMSEGGPFIFLGEGNPKETAFATALGVNDFVYGWQDAFGNSNTEVDPYESMGTTEYTRHVGGMGVTLECGHHHNTDAADVGYAAIVNALKHLGMIEGSAPTSTTPRCVQMKQAFYKEREGKFAKPWKHYDAVSKGETLATYEDGSTITAPNDGFIVLPKHIAEVSKEWFFFGVASDLP